MTLIKLTNQIINLDNVSQITSHVTENDFDVFVIFNHNDADKNGLFKIRLSGTEASAFMSLLQSSDLIRAAISPIDIEKDKNEKKEKGKKIAAAFGKTSRQQIDEATKANKAKESASSFGQMGKRKLAL